MVWVDIKLPDSITPVGALITNGRCFYDGQRYHVKTSVAMDLNSRMWLAWVQDARIEGRWIDRKSVKPQAINGATGQQLPVLGKFHHIPAEKIAEIGRFLACVAQILCAVSAAVAPASGASSVSAVEWAASQAAR